jgi:hypothetical protein
MALDFSNAGYVYILTNESLGSLVKIGFTKNPPEQRASELYTTGVPTPYRVWSYDFVESANKVEEEVHVRLFKNRSNRDREFFCISPHEAKKVVDQVILEVREDFLKNGQKQKQAQYSNPKFVEIIKFFKQNQGKLFSDNDLAKELKISQKGVGQLIYMLETQETPVLYSHPDPRQDKKYGIYVKFGAEQLDVLIKKYPNLEFKDLKPLFEKKQTFQNKKNDYKKSTHSESKSKTSNVSNKTTNNNAKTFSNFNPLNYNNPKFIELIKVLKENQGKLLNTKDISKQINDNLNTKPEISADGVRKIISILENHQFDIVFIVPKTEKQDERFGIDFKFDKTQLMELDKLYPKMNLKNLESLFVKKQPVRSQEQSRSDIDALKLTEVDNSKVQHKEKEDREDLKKQVTKIREDKKEEQPIKAPVRSRDTFKGIKDYDELAKTGGKKFRF